MKKEYAIAKFN